MAATADNLLTMVRGFARGDLASHRDRPRQFGADRDGPRLGGNARTGMEDTLYLRKGELAPSNRAFVSRTMRLAEALDLPVASVEETEALLRLSGDQR